MILQQRVATLSPGRRAAVQYYPGPPRRHRATRTQTVAVAMAASGAVESSSPAPAVVSPQWLSERLKERPGSVRVLDASWYLPAMGRDAAAEFRAARIPGARFFDTDGVALASTDLPHMLPPEGAFAAAMDALGVSNGNGSSDDDEKQNSASHVVVYDGLGTFASPRLWWSLRAMGHDRVSVLSGGLPAWRAAGFPVEEGWEEDDKGPIDCGAAAAARAAQQEKDKAAAAGAPAYRAKLRPNAAWSFEQMLEATTSKASAGGGGGANAKPPPLILDARPAARFRGADPEPRAHLRRGHMPGAVNVPFAALLEGGEGPNGLSGARLKSPEALRAAFAAAGVVADENNGLAQRQVVCSCGSGLTACIVALGLHEATQGKVDAAVYDASWCEWGARDDAPIDNPSAA